MMSALETNFGQTPSQTVGPYFAYGLAATQYGYDFDQPFDAVLALDLTLAYNVKQSPDAFEVPAKPFGLLPVGIPVPKDDTALRDAVQAALKKVQENGTYDELLAKWNLTDQALTGAPINTGT